MIEPEPIPGAALATQCQPGSLKHFRQVMSRWAKACDVEALLKHDVGALDIVARDLTAAQQDMVALTRWMVENHPLFRVQSIEGQTAT
jgi:hypothetical protein